MLFKKDSDSDPAKSLFEKNSHLDQAKSKNFIFNKSPTFYKEILTTRITKYCVNEVNFILH